MPAVDRALLRLATYELAFEPDLPDRRRRSTRRSTSPSAFSTDDSPSSSTACWPRRGRRPRRRAVGGSVSCPAALLVDMDGVIRHWDDGDRRRAATSCSASSRAPSPPSPSTPDLLRRADDGELTDEEWRAEVGALPRRRPRVRRRRRRWRRGSSDEFTIDDEVVELVRAVRGGGGTPVAAVERHRPGSRPTSRRVGLADAFDVGRQLDAGSRVAKPDAGIYAHAAEAVGVAPGDVPVRRRPARERRRRPRRRMPAVRFRSPARSRRRSAGPACSCTETRRPGGRAVLDATDADEPPPVHVHGYAAMTPGSATLAGRP